LVPCTKPPDDVDIGVVTGVFVLAVICDVSDVCVDGVVEAAQEDVEADVVVAFVGVTVAAVVASFLSDVKTDFTRSAAPDPNFLIQPVSARPLRSGKMRRIVGRCPRLDRISSSCL
jgi:hypothetical protein